MIIKIGKRCLLRGRVNTVTVDLASTIRSFHNAMLNYTDMNRGEVNDFISKIVEGATHYDEETGARIIGKALRDMMSAE